MEICDALGGLFSGNSFTGACASSSRAFRRRISNPNVLRCATDAALRDSDSRNRLFVLGMGYVGEFFAQELKIHGWAVSGTCRSVSKMSRLKERGFNVYHFDGNDPDLTVLTLMKSHTHLLVSIPPVDGVGDPLLQHGQILRDRLIDGNLQWLGYLSSTNVYGNSSGAWVDEDYPTCSTSSSAKLRVASEGKWLELGRELGLTVQIFRLGGIYGPGRSAVDTIIKQRPPSESQRKRALKLYTSRIHVADICQALKANIGMPNPKNTIYNIVDDEPASRAEVFAFAQHLIREKQKARIGPHLIWGLPIPKDEKDHQVEKRVSNGRMKKELGVHLIHPSYRSGLRSISHSS